MFSLNNLGEIFLMAGVETIKAGLAKTALQHLVIKTFGDLAKKDRLAYGLIKHHVIWMPMYEEAIFRGFILAAKGMDYCWQRGKEKKLTDKEKIRYQNIRIHVTAILFGLSHTQFVKININVLLGRTPFIHDESFNSLKAFAWTYFTGLNYGYLAEKCNTISLGILVHGFCNSIYFFVEFQKITSNVAYACIFGMQAALAFSNLKGR